MASELPLSYDHNFSIIKRDSLFGSNGLRDDEFNNQSKLLAGYPPLGRGYDNAVRRRRLILNFKALYQNEIRLENTLGADETREHTDYITVLYCLSQIGLAPKTGVLTGELRDLTKRWIGDYSAQVRQASELPEELPDEEEPIGILESETDYLRARVLHSAIVVGLAHQAPFNFSP